MADQVENLRQFGRETGVVDDGEAANLAQIGLSVVILPGGSMTVTQSAADLFTHIAPTHRLFLRDGKVYELLLRHGQQVLEELKPAAACSKFEEFVQFKKWTKDEKGKTQLAPTILTKETAEKYLSASATNLLPEIRGMINCPIIVERNGGCTSFKTVTTRKRSYLSRVGVNCLQCPSKEPSSI